MFTRPRWTCRWDAPRPARAVRDRRKPRPRAAGVRRRVAGGTLAEEIDTPGQGQVRALRHLAGNPVLSTPNGARLDARWPGSTSWSPSTSTSTRPRATRTDPAAVVPAGARPLRPGVPPALGAQRRQVLARPSSAARGGAARLGDLAGAAARRGARDGGAATRPHAALAPARPARHAGPGAAAGPHGPRPCGRGLTLRRLARRTASTSARCSPACPRGWSRRDGGSTLAPPRSRPPSRGRKRRAPGGRRPGADRAAAPAQQQLLDAQLSAADEGPRPLHPADAPGDAAARGFADGAAVRVSSRAGRVVPRRLPTR